MRTVVSIFLPAAVLGLCVPAARAAEALQSFELRNLSASKVAAQVAALEMKKLDDRLGTLAGAAPVSIKIDRQTALQAAILLRTALHDQAGVVLEEQMPGTLRAVLSFELHNLSSRLLVGRIAAFENKKLDDQLGAETGAIPVSVKIEAPTATQASALLRAALLAQTGVELLEQPRGTLLARPPAHPPAPPKSADREIGSLNLPRLTLSSAFDLYRNLSGQEVMAPPELTESDIAVAFVLEKPMSTREAAVLLRNTLLSAGVILDDLPDGRLGARLATNLNPQPDSAPAKP